MCSILLFRSELYDEVIANIGPFNSLVDANVWLAFYPQKCDRYQIIELSIPVYGPV